MAAATLLLSACGAQGPLSPQGNEPTASQAQPEGTGARQEGGMRIEITIGGESFRATLADSAAARDLLDQLPVTVQMRDHGGVEKTGRLPSSLSLDGQPDGADPDVGALGYYAPGNDLVLYYGDQSYHDGIVVLGQLEGDAAERIADMDGPVTATVTAAAD